MAALSLKDIYKYGYGLLKLDQNTLYQMDMFEFLERVEGALLWHEFEVDEHLNNQAWYTANLMLASGNLKKGTSVLDLKKGLYKSLEDREEEAIPEQVKLAQKKKDAEDEKAKLIKRFNLDQGVSN